MEPINPSAVRYIKLGRQGGWFEDCRERSLIALGHDDVSHCLALAGDWDAVGAEARRLGRSVNAARQDVREARDFYELGNDVLWITFDCESLWWTFAEREVCMTEPGAGPGSRWRRAIGGWRCTDIQGGELRIADLSTKLTCTRSYRRTICEVEARDYLLRRINAEPEPAVEAARKAQADAITAARDLITALHEADFELLADLIFANGGWRRVSVVGETMKDVDLVLEQPVTGERAFVQVKSRASHATLADYEARYRASDGTFERMFFLCHSPSKSLISESNDVEIWAGDVLGKHAVRAGLMDWLIERNS